MDQEGSNAQKLVQFNSPNSKLSNDTPHAYGTCKYKLPVFNGYKGSIRAPIGDQKDPNAQKLIQFNSPTCKLSNDTQHAYGTLKNKNPVFRAIRGR